MVKGERDTIVPTMPDVVRVYCSTESVSLPSITRSVVGPSGARVAGGTVAHADAAASTATTASGRTNLVCMRASLVDGASPRTMLAPNTTIRTEGWNEDCQFSGDPDH